MARRKRKSHYGILYHAGASSTRAGSGDRTVTVKVEVHRNIGASRQKQFCGHAYIPKTGRARRKLGYRHGDTVCASTPTVTVKRALRKFVSKSWY